jgi:hypothetical protein
MGAVIRRILSMAALGLWVASCQLDTSEPAPAREVSARLQRPASLDSALWRATDSVHLRVESTDGATLLDRGVRFGTGRIEFGTLRVGADLGLRIEARGFLNGARLWDAIVTLPASEQAQEAVLVPELASAWLDPSAATTTTPTLDSLDRTPWSSGPLMVDGAVRLYVNCRTPGAVLRYRLDGSAPTGTSSPYDPATGILVDSSRTVVVGAFTAGLHPSAPLSIPIEVRARGVVSATPSVAAWTEGVWDRTFSVRLASPTPQAVIHYTLDGSAPGAGSPVYRDGVVVDTSSNLRTVVFAGKSLPSEEKAFAFRLQARPPEMTVGGATAWAPDTFDASVDITWASSTPGAQVGFTLDGSVPVRPEPSASGTRTVDSSAVVTAVAWGVGRVEPSQPSVRRVVLKVRPVVLDTAGNPWGTLRIGMSSATENAAIRWTDDGREPTPSSPVYQDSLSLAADAPPLGVSARAWSVRNPKVEPSAIATDTFTPAGTWRREVSYGTLVDARDGRVYRTVHLAGREWMAENLAFRSAGSICYRVKGSLPGDTSLCPLLGRMYFWDELASGGASLRRFHPRHPGDLPGGVARPGTCRVERDGSLGRVRSGGRGGEGRSGPEQPGRVGAVHSGPGPLRIPGLAGRGVPEMERRTRVASVGHLGAARELVVGYRRPLDLPLQALCGVHPVQPGRGPRSPEHVG